MLAFKISPVLRSDSKFMSSFLQRRLALPKSTKAAPVATSSASQHCWVNHGFCSVTQAEEGAGRLQKERLLLEQLP